MRYVLVALLFACGGGGNSGVDASKPDALLDAPEAPLNVHRFVVDKQKVPQNTNEARMFAFDLDGDVTLDNQLGMVLGTLAGQGINSQTASDMAVDRGAQIQLVELGVDLALGGPGTLAMFTGANPMPTACYGASDTTCRKHLSGMASFTVAADSARDIPLNGTLAGSAFTAGPGHLQLQIAVMSSKPVALNLIGARVKMNATATNITEGIIGGGVTTADRDAKIYPGIRDGANDAIMRDCTMPTAPPSCGCAAGSTGKSMTNLFDTSPKDCTVSLDEIRNSTLLQSLFAPDIMVEGQQVLSVGVGFTAVHAGFVP
jgi:hypothetical protein